MIATYQVKPQEIETFVAQLRSYRAVDELKITVETVTPQPTPETQSATNARILRSWQAANSGEPPYKTLTVEEMEAMIK
ncbi:MAG: hypothetical protein LBP75_03065 [Planctomycetota bacterium]|jgi:hypothetical protein|nr:hypothetical protein [Planctomycetota bacterium]